MKLSIITINYNNKTGFQKTIDSVVTQTWQDFEWVIIDGGSTDGSKELIVSVSEKIREKKLVQGGFFWCSEIDDGIYNAQNKGILKAEGDYVLLLNSGDYLASPDVLSEVFSHDMWKEDFILGNMIVHEEDGDYIWDIKEDALTARQFFYGTLPHPGTFIKRSLFDHFGLYDESFKICADWKFFVETILYGAASVKKIPVKQARREG